MKLCLCFFLISCSLLGINTEDERIVKSNRKFTGDLFKRFDSSEKGNYLFSPFSAESVLSLAEIGAKGATADEIKKALYLPSEETIKTRFKDIQKMYDSVGSYSLKSLNKIYIEQELKIKEAFKDLAQDVFQIETENLDFSNSEAARETINKWVASQTNSKIPEIVGAKDLNSKVKSVFLNSVYLKALWSNKLDVQKEKFHINDTASVDVDMMHYRGVLNFHECNVTKTDFVELVFKDAPNATFVIGVPQKRDGVYNLAQNLNKVGRGVKKHYVDIKFPKFSIESRFDLTDKLQDMGIKTAFSSDADLSLIAGEKGNLVMEKFIQKAVLEVNEDGVDETGVSFARNLNIHPKNTKEPKMVVADHPFLFWVNINDLLLFCGRVVFPTPHNHK